MILSLLDLSHTEVLKTLEVSNTQLFHSYNCNTGTLVFANTMGFSQETFVLLVAPNTTVPKVSTTDYLPT